MNSKYRIKFTKLGNIVFIGHLDLLKVFQRCMKRSRLPIAYSQGFNPHQLEVFAIPLSLGMSSTGEYVDIELTQDIPTAEIQERLQAVLPVGIDILSVRNIVQGEKNCAAAICAADYVITLDRLFENIDVCIDQIKSADEIIMTRVVKKKEKPVDIAPMIYDIRADNSGEKTVLYTRLATGSQGNIKTDLLLEYIYQKMGADFAAHTIRTRRTEMYRLENGEFVSL